MKTTTIEVSIDGKFFSSIRLSENSTEAYRAESIRRWLDGIAGKQMLEDRYNWSTLNSEQKKAIADALNK